MLNLCGRHSQMLKNHFWADTRIFPNFHKKNFFHLDLCGAHSLVFKIQL